MTTPPLILTRTQSRSIDAAAIQELGINSLVLMENAARGVVDVIGKHLQPVGRIVIACGYGNNGGDGLAIARQLAAVDTPCEVLLFKAGKQLSNDAEANLQILKAAGIEVRETNAETVFNSLSSQDLIVDCLLGTAVQSAARPPFDSIIQQINASKARVLSVDVPSGMNCDTGLPVGDCVRADRTVTFIGLKQGFCSPQAAAWVGTTTVAHIGLPVEWVRRKIQSEATEP